MNFFEKSLSSRVLFRPVDASTLGIFRIFWGIAMCIEANWLHNQLHELHHPAAFHFYYEGFSWIRHFPYAWMMEIELITMLLSALMITFGVLFRTAAILFTITYSHFFFSEAIAYNNHFYLIILINFLLCFTRADRKLSLTSRAEAKKGIQPEAVPVWQYQILKLQVIVVYFYGAVAKINHDWLIEMEPVRFWLTHSTRIPEFLSNLLKQEWFTPLTAWGGLFIDLLCPFMLLFRRTRLVAIAILALFHWLNSQIFNIGYFPAIAIILIIPFLPPDLFTKSPTSTNQSETLSKLSKKRRVVFSLLIFYFSFQILFPLRWHLWSPRNPLWTDTGQRFAWRMMLKETISDFQIRFADPELQQWVDQRPYILPEMAPVALYQMGQTPHYIWQYVQAIKSSLKEYGKEDSAIHVFATCSLNGRSYYPLIDPNVDLSKADFPFLSIPDWVVPLPDDLRPDFSQIQPLGDKTRFSAEAIDRWLEMHPGPAVEIRNLYRDEQEDDYLP